jgi:hypothetical protein
LQTTHQPHQLAQELIARTSSLARIHAGLGMGAGMLLGAALLANGGELRLVGAAVGGMIGASIGHTLGAARATAMRLQALTVLERDGAPR